MTKNIIKIILCVCWMSDALASYDYYMAIKGGISLGSYETGVNWALLDYVKNEDKDSKFVAFSGASAGSINSLLSAIHLCSKDDSGSIDDNFMRDAWDIGIQEILIAKENRKSTEYKNETGILTKEAFNKVKDELYKRVENTNHRECSFIISMSVTLERPHLILLKQHNTRISQQRYVVPIKVNASENGRITFHNVNIKSKDKDELYPYMKMVEEKTSDNSSNHYPIAFDTVFNLAMASSAFPLAFEPVDLTFCFVENSKDEEACTPERASKERFSDGGMFDNSPIGVSEDIIHTCKENNSDACTSSNEAKVIYINPDSYRVNAIEPRKIKDRDIKTGLADYGSYVFNVFSTATEREYRDALRNLGEELNISSRYHHLTADFHFHFGAFYADVFRMHDYLIGTYDGRYLTSRLICIDEDEKKLKDDETKGNISSCIRENMAKWINNIGDGEASEDTLEFFKFLYNEEFEKSFVLTNLDFYSNHYIYLYHGFVSSSRTSNSQIAFDEYIDNLRTLKKGKFSYIDLSKTSDLENIIDSGPEWVLSTLDDIYQNVLYMQRVSSECKDGEDCKKKELNKTIKTVMAAAEPVALSYIRYKNDSTWPLAMCWPFPCNDIFSYSLRWGFNVPQKNQVVSLETRFNIIEEFSLDAGLNANYFGAELEGDNYWSLSIGFSKHRDSLILPVCSLGIDFAGEGEVYKDKFQSLYASFGLLNELIILKAAYSFDDLEGNTRDNVGFTISFDVTKVLDIAF